MPEFLQAQNEKRDMLSEVEGAQQDQPQATYKIAGVLKANATVVTHPFPYWRYIFKS